ncbi:response regulator transcription factor [Solicola sp. PLA-1-18]|uniref:response regulator transcription factor n=1 Tax=Solicola sp. PLA-1-18 TaxID=3380532 RepID=UPI003B7AF7F5
MTYQGARVAVVVDDDGDVRGLISHVLSLQGFTVHEAATGRDGVRLAREANPDLITLDLGLPDVDGTQVCRAVREFTDAYVVMVTARQDEIDRLIGLEIGADDYVSKPFSPRELQARIAAMFRRPRTSVSAAANAPAAAPPADTQLRHGDLAVDPDGRVATLETADGVQELTLTRTEFDILATLLSNPVKVWGRDALLRQVWGEGWTNDHHLVEVHMGNLRRKLGDSGRSAGFIRTVRGVGYRMEPIPASSATAAS